MPASGRRVDEGGSAERWVGASTGRMAQRSVCWWEAVCRRRKWPATPSSCERNEEAESTRVDDLKVSCVGLITGGPEQSESEEDKTWRVLKLPHSYETKHWVLKITLSLQLSFFCEVVFAFVSDWWHEVWLAHWRCLGGIYSRHHYSMLLSPSRAWASEIPRRLISQDHV